MNWFRSRPALAVFLLSFVVFNSNARIIPSGDTLPAALLPFALYWDHSVSFDRFDPHVRHEYGGNVYFWKQYRDAHYYALYPIFPSLLLTPFYAPIAFAPRSWPVATVVLVARVLEKLAASVVAALTVAMFFLLARRMLPSPKRAFLLTAVFAFATETWAVSSQGLWQHGMSELMIVLGLLFLSRNSVPWAALFTALSVAMRPTNAVFVIASMLVLAAVSRRRDLTWYTLCAVAVGALLAAYNLSIYGDVRGGYQFAFSGNPLAGFAGLIFSPARGLLVYSPVLAFIALRPTLAGEHRVILLICAVFAAFHVLLYSFWPLWWGGHSFGPRLLTDIMPCLTLLLVPLFSIERCSMPLRIAFTLVFAFSIFVQVVGTFSYPAGQWNGTPVPIDSARERLWDWRDNPIGRGVRAGFNVDGYRIAWQALRAVVSGPKPDAPNAVQ